MLSASAAPYFGTVELLGHLSLPLATVLFGVVNINVSHQLY
jgi:hypothetical protein